MKLTQHDIDQVAKMHLALDESFQADCHSMAGGFNTELSELLARIDSHLCTVIDFDSVKSTKQLSLLRDQLIDDAFQISRDIVALADQRIGLVGELDERIRVEKQEAQSHLGAQISAATKQLKELGLGEYEIDAALRGAKSVQLAHARLQAAKQMTVHIRSGDNLDPGAIGRFMDTFGTRLTAWVYDYCGLSTEATKNPDRPREQREVFRNGVLVSPKMDA